MGRATIVGLVAAALGFAHLSFSSTTTVNGVVTDCTYVDLAPFLFGALATVAGALAVAHADRPGRNRSRERLLGAVGIAFGVLHLLRGLGVVDLLSGSPC